MDSTRASVGTSPLGERFLVCRRRRGRRRPRSPGLIGVAGSRTLLVQQEGANAQRRTTEEAATARIAATSKAEGDCVRTQRYRRRGQGHRRLQQR